MDVGPRVLLVEADDAVAARLAGVIAELDDTAQILRASDVAGAVASLEGALRLDAAVVSARLPDGPGLRIARWALGLPDPPPMVLLAEDEPPELWAEAAKAGVAVVLPREAVTAERLRGGLTMARDRSRTDRLGRLVSEAAISLNATDRLDDEIGSLLNELRMVTGAHGVRLSIGVLSHATRRWSRGDVDQPDSAALTIAGRSGGAVTLLELFDRHRRSWTAVRPPLTTLCEVITAALVQRRAVDEVRESAARLRDLAENVPDAIISVDAEGRIVAANRRFCDDVGCQDPVGRQLAELVQAGGLAELAARAVEEARYVRTAVALPDQPVTLAGGLDRWFAVRASPDDAGTVHVVLPDTTTRVLGERRLTELALTDHLTGLANRRLALDRLQHALDHVGRGQSHLVVSLCDVDHFKSTNDVFGHAAGDAVLLALADRLRGSVRAADTAARLGGDEFLVISEAVDDPTAAALVIDRLHRRLCGPVEVDGDSLDLSVSLGYVVVGEPGLSADDVLRRADQALYAAKAGGRGRYATVAASDTSDGEEHPALDLARAWDEQRVVLRWSPVTTLDGHIVGARASLWWLDEDGRPHDPDEHGASGSTSGTAHRWMLGHALRCRARWREEGWIDEHLTVHVAVSPRRLADSDLVADVRSELAASGCDPCSLVLAVDDAAVSGVPGAPERLDELAALGVRVHLDHVGLGAVPVDRLAWPSVSGVWLDPSLLDGVAHDRRRAAVVDGLLGLAAAAGLQAGVGGLDSPEQLDALAGRGVTATARVAVWGPVVGEPVDADAFVDRLVLHP